MAISKKRIFVIADELDANGQNPTLALVRKKLGGGSYTTISEAMTEWKARKSAKETRTLREPAPPSVVDRLGELGADIWAIALELAQGRFAAEREMLEATRTSLETAKAEAAELADQFSSELDAMKEKVALLEKTAQEARNEAVVLREKMAGLSERATTAETRVTEIEKRAEDLNAELARVNEQNSSLVKALTASVEKTKEP